MAKAIGTQRNFSVAADGRQSVQPISIKRGNANTKLKS